MIQPHTAQAFTATIPRPTAARSGYRTCPRCGITFPLNSRSVWTRQTHCKDCRWYQKRGQA